MRKVFEDHKAIILFNHDFSKLDDVIMVERLEQLDLSNRCDRKLHKVSNAVVEDVFSPFY